MENAQFYFDYDLGKEHTGLDFIIENNLSERSTLVTSMHQDEEIQNRCIKNGIKILPKQVFNNAEIYFVKEKEISSKSYILIDDDYLMHMSWKLEADQRGIDFHVFSSVADFLAEESKFSKDSVIYVDSNLADGLKGEVESEKIADLGFTEIYLATGYSAKDIVKPSWIKDIVGKRPEFH